jgi:hypothetical protein
MSKNGGCWTNHSAETQIVIDLFWGRLHFKQQGWPFYLFYRKKAGQTVCINMLCEKPKLVMFWPTLIPFLLTLGAICLCVGTSQQLPNSYIGIKRNHPITKSQMSIATKCLTEAEHCGLLMQWTYPPILLLQQLYGWLGKISTRQKQLGLI